MTDFDSRDGKGVVPSATRSAAFRTVVDPNPSAHQIYVASYLAAGILAGNLETKMLDKYRSASGNGLFPLSAKVLKRGKAKPLVPIEQVNAAAEDGLALALGLITVGEVDAARRLSVDQRRERKEMLALSNNKLWQANEAIARSQRDELISFDSAVRLLEIPAKERADNLEVALVIRLDEKTEALRKLVSTSLDLLVSIKAITPKEREDLLLMPIKRLSKHLEDTFTDVLRRIKKTPESVA